MYQITLELKEELLHVIDVVQNPETKERFMRMLEQVNREMGW